MAIPWGVILVFLVIFLAFWEKKRSLKEILSGLGLKRKGSTKSVFWTLALIPLFLIIYLLLMMLSYFLGPVPFPQASSPNGGQAPVWYLYYMIIYAFFPVAVVEEAVARGYMLDRLMPEHPSTLAKASHAIIISSLLSTLYHLPAYLGIYSFSLVWAVALSVGNVFPWSIALSIAYVRARTRNILGPVLIHFLADSIPIILSVA
jgi:membrane protease YdiL (CAAX protease family)